LNFDAPDSLTAHRVARAEIEAWRGRCVDLYSRSELAVSSTLEAALVAGLPAPLRHLAGQRLSDLGALAASTKGTTKQHNALLAAIRDWQAMDESRSFLAHGVLKELLDRNGNWSAQLDIKCFKKNAVIDQRKVFSEPEAKKLETLLQSRFKTLSSQLGQLRTRLKA